MILGSFQGLPKEKCEEIKPDPHFSGVIGKLRKGDSRELLKVSLGASDCLERKQLGYFIQS